jgi:hypothetical protein
MYILAQMGDAPQLHVLNNLMKVRDKIIDDKTI